MLSRLLPSRPKFDGGVYLPMEPAGADPIRELAPPRRLCVPLALELAPPARPLVEVGDFVDAGAALARADEPGSPTIHAPLAGRIAGISSVDTARAADVPAIQIDVTPSGGTGMAPAIQGAHAASGTDASDGVDPAALEPPLNPVDLWASKGIAPFTLDDLASAADARGIVSTPDCRVGLGAALREAAALRVRHVIINGLQPEPRCTAPPRVLRKYLEAILAAGLLARNALQAKRLWLVVDAADRAMVRDCRSVALGTPARVLGLANKYPQAAGPLLAWTVTGRETPYGCRPVNVGVLILDPQTLADLWAGIRVGSPATHRVVAIGGPAALQPGHHRVPIGTSYGDLVERVGLRRPLVRLVDGGPLTGRSIESLNAVVSPATSTILLIDRDSDAIRSPGPCIRCGACQEDCPVGLDPQKLLEVHELGRWSAAAALYPHACVECGLCSYVCPAELPLAQAAIGLKHATPL